MEVYGHLFHQLLVIHKHLLLQLGQQLASPLPLPGLRDHVQQAKQLLHLEDRMKWWHLKKILTPMLAFLPESLRESSERPVSPTTFKHRCDLGWFVKIYSSLTPEFLITVIRWSAVDRLGTWRTSVKQGIISIWVIDLSYLVNICILVDLSYLVNICILVSVYLLTWSKISLCEEVARMSNLLPFGGTLKL